MSDLRLSLAVVTELVVMVAAAASDEDQSLIVVVNVRSLHSPV